MLNKQYINPIKNSNNFIISSSKPRQTVYFELFKLDKNKQIITNENNMLQHKINKNLLKLEVIQKKMDELKKRDNSNIKPTKVKPNSSNGAEEEQKMKKIKLNY